MELKIQSTHPSRICIENGSNFFWFCELLKKRSRKDFPLDCSCIVHLWNRQNCKKTKSDVVLTLDRLPDSGGYCSCPPAWLVYYLTVSAHLHTTKVAMYAALFNYFLWCTLFGHIYATINLFFVISTPFSRGLATLSVRQSVLEHESVWKRAFPPLPNCLTGTSQVSGFVVILFFSVLKLAFIGVVAPRSWVTR